MGRRARGRAPGPAEGTCSAAALLEVLNAPFADLGKHLRAAAPPPPPPPPRREVRPAKEPDEGTLLARAMADVVPSRPPRAIRSAGAVLRSATARQRGSGGAGASALVTGATRFDITDTREYIEGAVVSLDPRLPGPPGDSRAGVHRFMA
jgi:hypothetical protein